MLTQERLKEVLYYDPQTGIFTNKIYRKGTKGINSVAGTSDKDGYILIIIDGKQYKAHRLAWLYIKGIWPKFEIDHEDTVKFNNKFTNLREATSAQNKTNKDKRPDNKLGVKGVCKFRNKFKSSITVNKNSIHLGVFNTVEEASAAYQNAATKYHGKFLYKGENS